MYYLSILFSHFCPPAFTLPLHPSPFYLILIYCWSEPWQQNQLHEVKKKNKNKNLHQTKLCFCLWGNWFCLQRSRWNWAELSICHLACILSAFVSCNATVSHKITVSKSVFLSVWFLSAAYSRACATICSLIYFFPCLFASSFICGRSFHMCSCAKCGQY